jgi:hypothetical protein
VRHPNQNKPIEDYLVACVTTNGWPTLRSADFDRLLDLLPGIAKNLGFAHSAVKGAMTRAIRVHRPELLEKWAEACKQAKEDAAA